MVTKTWMALHTTYVIVYRVVFARVKGILVVGIDAILMDRLYSRNLFYAF